MVGDASSNSRARHGGPGSGDSCRTVDDRGAISSGRSSSLSSSPTFWTDGARTFSRPSSWPASSVRPSSWLASSVQLSSWRAASVQLSSRASSSGHYSFSLLSLAPCAPPCSQVSRPSIPARATRREQGPVWVWGAGAAPSEGDPSIRSPTSPFPYNEGPPSITPFQRVCGVTRRWS